VVWRLLAPVPPPASVLPPGAGNEEPKKLLEPEQERTDEAAERSVAGAMVIERHLHTPTVARDGDGDAAAIPILEPSQGGLH